MKQIADKNILIDFLKSAGFYTQKSLGQNFLVCQKTVQKVIEVANIQKTDLIIEIGAGVGTLTTALLESSAQKIISLEIDRKLIPLLTSVTEKNKKLVIENIDALKFDPPVDNYLLIANIPYYLTSPIFKYYLEHSCKPKIIVFIVQKEMAEKICADGKNQNLLSLLINIYGEPSIESLIEKDKFFPSPKVDSAILKIKVFQKSRLPLKYKKIFWTIVQQAFKNKRKKLKNTLGNFNLENKCIGDLIKKMNFSENDRPQTVGVEDWIKLAKNVL